jgi:hypothetical protein
MNNYLCKNCSTVVKSYNFPEATGCINAGMHQWTNLGEVGPNDFQCQKCELIVKSWNDPNKRNCPSHGNHKWRQLWIDDRALTYSIKSAFKSFRLSMASFLYNEGFFNRYD